MSRIIQNNFKCDIAEESMGKYFFKALKQQNKNRIVNIDAVTGKTLTSEELLQDSIKLATIFKNIGINKGDVITIINDNSIHTTSIILAGLYTGVVICFLNPKYSSNEMKHGLAISKPKLIICCEAAFTTVKAVQSELDYLGKLLITEAENPKLYDVETYENLLAKTSFDQTFEPLDIDRIEDDAMICLSSGTTGLPKGVMLNQECIRILADGYRLPSYIDGSDSDAVLFVIPIFHVFGLIVHLAVAANGAKSVLMKKFEPQVYLKSIQEYKVTLAFLVPPIVVYFAKSDLVRNYDVSSLRNLIVGGAPVSHDILKLAQAKLNGVHIRQGFGITETGCVTHLQPKNNTNIGTIGLVFPQILAKISDIVNNKTLGPLEVGELCIKSPGMMRGYINDDGLDPLHFDRDGFYHSGDLAYYDQNNCFYIVDRIKELIKYKGFQVPPAELEALLLTHSGVADCAVTAVPDERAGELPLALVVKKQNANVTEKQIVDYVAERISSQKHLYGGVIFVDVIPKNPSGKIIRRQLKEMCKNYQPPKVS